MMKLYNKIDRLRRDQTGVAAIEMAFVMPPFILMFLGAFDVGYSMYFRGVLDGAIQESARASALETAVAITNDKTGFELQDERLEKKLKDLAVDIDVTFDRKSYFSFQDVDRPEKFTESNANGVCDNNEQYEDENGNQTWDEDAGKDGIGGPKDVVLYTVTVTYNRIFPLWAFVGQSQKNTFSASTVLKNQPYDSQQISAVRNCT
jgi:Flp pilus assembly protein TadG